MFSRILKTIAVASMILMLSSAPALAMLYNFSGQITDDFGNPFGLTSGDSIFGSTFFEDGVIDATAILEAHAYADNPTATLEFRIGSLTLTQEDDSEAQAFFSEGHLTGFDYLSFDIYGSDGNLYEFNMSGSSAGQTSFTIFDEDFNEILLGNFETLPTAPVPLPGAMFLLGSGLVGLLGARKKFIKN